MAEDKIPFCVDLDGTLIRTDTLHEALLSLIKRSPSTAARLPFWLFGGKAKFKHSVANRVNLDASTLPYCENVLALVEEARRNERPIVLVTAAPASIADSVAENLGFFTDVLSSD